MNLILFILHEPSKLRAVMEAWNNAGVCGITVYASSGYKRITSSDILRDDLPLIFNIEDLSKDEEKTNRTLISIVKDDATVDRVVEATQQITGDLDNPNTGILTVIPVSRVYGLNRKDNENTGD